MLVRTVSRLHLGLIDLNGDLDRVDGGIGLALRSPYIEVRAEAADATRAEGPMSDRVREAAESVIDRIDGDPVHLAITASYPQHVGLGSGTQAALAAGTLAAHLNGADLTPRDIASITGRGGTSGIGVAAFEYGGFITDGGHSLEEKGGFLPSSASRAPPAPVTSRLDFPDWEIAVLLPTGKGAHGDAEREVFEQECPIPAREVERLSRVILMQLLPGVASADFPLFRDAVKEIQRVGFKRREVAMQPASREIIDQMQGRGCAAGMSSFGPAVYAIHPNHVDTDGLDADITRTRASNTGAEVTE